MNDLHNNMHESHKYTVYWKKANHKKSTYHMICNKTDKTNHHVIILDNSYLQGERRRESNRMGYEGASAVLITFLVLTWVLDMQVSSLCNN